MINAHGRYQGAILPSQSLAAPGENLGLVDFHVVSAGVSLGDAQGCCR